MLDVRQVAVDHLGHVGEVLAQALEPVAGQGHGFAPLCKVGLQRRDAAPLLVLRHRTALCDRAGQARIGWRQGWKLAKGRRVWGLEERGNR